MSDRLRPVSKSGIEAAPDLLIEILSPSNLEHDRVRKRARNTGGGVREHWLVGAAATRIEVLVPDGDRYRVHVRAGDDEPGGSAVLLDLSFPASVAFTAAIGSWPRERFSTQVRGR